MNYILLIKHLWFFLYEHEEFRRKEDRENEYYLKTTNFHQNSSTEISISYFNLSFWPRHQKKKTFKDRWERSVSDPEYQKIDLMIFS